MLKSRALAYSYTSTPYIITAFGGAAASQSLFTPGNNWRWGFGALAIVLPFVGAPFYAVLYVNERKTQSTETERPTKPKRYFSQPSIAFLIEFDGDCILGRKQLAHG